MNLGIFESLAADQTESRLAGRKALLLAQTRIDKTVGGFLRSASSMAEFDARFELVKEDYLKTVNSACEELGVEARAHEIGNVIYGNYRKAVRDDDDDDKDDHREDWDDHEDPADRGDREEKEDEAAGLDFPTGSVEHKESAREAAPLDGKLSESDKGSCSECGKDGFLKGGVCGPCRGKKLHGDEDKHIDVKEDDGDADDSGETMDFSARTAEYPEQSCPNCGASAEGPHRAGCPQAPGASSASYDFNTPKVTHQEAQELIERRRHERGSRTADEKGNTDLDGPEPKMDKQRWSPTTVKEIDVPSERHPTKKKDIVEIMEKKNLTGPAHEMGEIGETTTTTEKLPTADEKSDDSGFAGNNMEMAPHTKTFGDGGQTKPVTNPTLEKAARWSRIVSAS